MCTSFRVLPAMNERVGSLIGLVYGDISSMKYRSMAEEDGGGSSRN
jgi:hypothetical protein